jgi:mono/diheme cytochrome c family protein
MMRRRRIRTGAATVVLAVAVVLGAARSSEPEAPKPNAPAPTTNSNASAANTLPAPDVRPVALEGEALARTAKLFDATCATCHTTGGKGDPHHRKDDIPDFTDRSWQAGETDAELRDAIANGKEKIMPAFGGKLSAEQIDELVAYVRGFPARPGGRGARPDAPRRAGDETGLSEGRRPSKAGSKTGQTRSGEEGRPQRAWRPPARLIGEPA